MKVWFFCALIDLNFCYNKFALRKASARGIFFSTNSQYDGRTKYIGSVEFVSVHPPGVIREIYLRLSLRRRVLFHFFFTFLAIIYGEIWYTQKVEKLPG